MDTDIKLAAEDLQSAYEHLMNAFTMAQENKDVAEYKLQDAMNRTSEAMSHVNVLVAAMPPDTQQVETPIMVDNGPVIMGRANKANATRGN